MLVSFFSSLVCLLVLVLRKVVKLFWVSSMDLVKWGKLRLVILVMCFSLLLVCELRMVLLLLLLIVVSLILGVCKVLLILLWEWCWF